MLLKIVLQLIQALFQLKNSRTKLPKTKLNFVFRVKRFMAERYETKVPVRFTRDGTVTLQQDQGSIYEYMSNKKDPQQTEESTYTDLQFGDKQPTSSRSSSSSSSSSSSNGGAQVGMVSGKTSTKVIIAVAIVLPTCFILVAFALIMAGVTLALIQSLESQVTQLREELQNSTQQSTHSSALIQSLESQVTQLREEQQEYLRSQELHPYQNCYTDTTKERTIPPTTGTYYTKRVGTDFLNINATVSHW